MFRAARVFLISIVVLLIALPAAAQDTPLPPLAAVRADQVVLVGFGAEPQPITADASFSYQTLTWSPDGNTLAFYAIDEDYVWHLMLYDRVTGVLTTLDSNLTAGFPLRFVDDGRQLLYVKADAETQTLHHVYTLDLTPGAAANAIATFEFVDGCGGGSMYPLDWRYFDETEGLGGDHLILEITPVGLVHSMDCYGFQTGLLDLTNGIDTSLGVLSRAVISPNGMRIAGMSDLAGEHIGDQLIVYDLALQMRTVIPTTETPDQVVWSAENSSQLFYSARTQTETPMPFDAAELERISAAWGQAPPALREASIHTVDLTTGADVELWRGDGDAVGRMIPAPGGTALYGSLIPNGHEFFAAIAAGTLDVEDPSGYAQWLDYALVEFFVLPLDGGPFAVLDVDLNHASLNAHTYAQQ